ncbi:hypothetical protein QBC33DRAFT_603628 [Phialemonium atrogriseum]|uniref:Uncharacterized protein n=1 Tax=Phialemonium atrogriseum TaxID=1093897 RepID=A0AAJ0BTS9_9PEZI|nr:uncharacterized protein QBC33DRAFT_603628 [Phialemonium atrogriseum]KAK1761901.1 hypothetical protein QBC33DRAFT_603628 [Phialemonium atrogriseum]
MYRGEVICAGAYVSGEETLLIESLEGEAWQAQVQAAFPSRSRPVRLLVNLFRLLLAGLHRRFGHLPGTAEEIARIRDDLAELGRLPDGWRDGVSRRLWRRSVASG